MQHRELQRPPNRAEVAELTDFLASTPDALPFWEAHGFLTAIASAPTTLLPSVWQPVLLGDCEFASLDHANRIFGLVLRLYNHILSGLEDENPIVPTDFDEDLASWCAGYLRAARMDDVWPTDEDGAEILLLVAILSGDFDMTGEEDANGNIIEDPTPHMQRCRASLTDMVCATYDFWKAWRRENRTVPVASRSPKIGRNEPCPCGSGRKFKKCCALTAN